MPFVIGEKLGAGKSGKIEQYVPRCTGTISVSADNCSIEYSFKCPQASAPGIFQKVGTITWAPDGKSANESQDYSEYSDGGAQTCSGKYAPSISK